MSIKTRRHERYDSIKRLLWLKCHNCGKLIYYKDYRDNLRVCPSCGFAYSMTPHQRFSLMFDEKDWVEIPTSVASDDPLEFTDRMPYTERLAEAREETRMKDAFAAADGKIGGIGATIGVLNGEFMMGSMGRTVGDGIIASINHAIAEKRPYIIFTSSGGARMQENILSLMQMARTTAAVNKLNAAGLPYMVVLADPTYGGVTASFAMLGDIHIAESGARIGFAGKRVIEQNLREKLPSNFQTADYLYEHGMVDLVCKRKDLKDKIVSILSVLTKKELPDVPKISAPETPAAETRRHHHGRRREKVELPKAFEKVMLARNENRPHFLDYVVGLTSGWTPLAGDRLFAEDPALVGGICYFRGIPSVLLGHELGRTIETRQKHRFGMPNPEGYRKAQRLMRLAERFHLPVITLVDTTGAFAGREAEERGQSEAVARSIQTGLSIATPLVSVIVGQGGSGGAIALATGDRVMMMENAIYSVIAPESCASILWKDNKFAPEASDALKLTASDLLELNVIDGIIKEPAGGAHTDWQAAMELLSDSVVRSIAELQQTPADELPALRAKKFFAMTRDVEIHASNRDAEA
ncbi:MAG: acetyl-CoA carboxylase carboxyltransferase subunit alpha [Rickettsiales bacterium]|jgi:acetyl-CoA carboxylase carboxyl transferase subunit beta|nr:acetyl-CoA carboxylase carboxyltransferase subunit alpha [Rickettsiales bacterium]